MHQLLPSWRAMVRIHLIEYFSLEYFSLEYFTRIFLSVGELGLTHFHDGAAVWPEINAPQVNKSAFNNVLFQVDKVQKRNNRYGSEYRIGCDNKSTGYNVMFSLINFLLFLLKFPQLYCFQFSVFRDPWLKPDTYYFCYYYSILTASSILHCQLQIGNSVTNTTCSSNSH